MVRGNMRGGRGGSMRGGGVGGAGGGLRGPFKKPFVPRHPFDMTLAEVVFPKVNAAGAASTTLGTTADDAALTNALLKRNTDLTPTPTEQTAIANLVSKVQSVLDNLVVMPGDGICQLEEVRQVGSFKKGTMLTGSNTADIVAILKLLPTREVCTALCNKVMEDLRTVRKSGGAAVSAAAAAAAALAAANGGTEGGADALQSEVHERGFAIFGALARVEVLVTTVPQNIRKLEPDVHYDTQLMQAHLAAIRHSRWFEENGSHSSIKVLIRLLRDMCKRFAAFAPLSPWMTDLLAHFAIMNNPSRQALPINLAFRRVFQLLAAGLFLPGSAGISDPCENGHLRVHTALTLEQQDVCCMTAQTLLRVLAHGGYKHILGLEGNTSIAREMSVWDGVVVSPLHAVYEKSDHKKGDDGDGDEEDMENEEADDEESIAA